MWFCTEGKKLNILVQQIIDLTVYSILLSEVYKLLDNILAM